MANIPHNFDISATIAHEGNPRTDSLVVAGTLDGNAFLLFDFPLVGPNLPRTGEVVADNYRIETPFTLKYVLTDFQYGTDAFDHGSGYVQYNKSSPTGNTATFRAPAGTVLEYSRKDNIKMYGAVISPTVRSNGRYIDRLSTSLSFVFVNKTNIDTYDAAFLDWANLGKRPTNSDFSSFEVNQRVTINAIAGDPFFGVAVGVDPRSTADDFTGYVLAYDWTNDTQYLMRYFHRSLSQFGDILGSNNPTVKVAGSTLSLTLSKGTGVSGAVTTWTISGGSLSVSSLADTDLPYFAPDMRCALVNLPSTGDSGGDDSIVWADGVGILFIA